MAEPEDLFAQFPGLRDAAHKITSGESDLYKCVSWVENDMHRYWDPDHTWPRAVEPATDDLDDVGSYLTLFRWTGFEQCSTADLEPGYLKIAVYSVTHEGLGPPRHEFKHVARQLPSGRWSSKAGFCATFGMSNSSRWRALAS